MARREAVLIANSGGVGVRIPMGWQSGARSLVERAVVRPYMAASVGGGEAKRRWEGREGVSDGGVADHCSSSWASDDGWYDVRVLCHVCVCTVQHVLIVIRGG